MENHRHLIRFEHGTRNKRKLDLPDWVFQLHTGNYSVFYAPPHIVDLRMKLVDHWLVTHLGPNRSTAAINSDKMYPQPSDPGHPMSLCKDSEFDCKAASTRGLIGFYFSDSFLENVLQGHGKIEKLKYDNARPPGYDKHLHRLFRLTHCALVQGNSDIVYIEHLLSALIVRYSTIHGIVESGRKRGVSSAQLKRAEEYMRVHLDKKLQLLELASVAGMSPYHFSRSFKSHFGQSPYLYLQKLRLKKAIDLLKNTDWSIEVIAEQVGFSTQSHFGTFFLRQTGTSPGAFRKMLN